MESDWDGGGGAAAAGGALSTNTNIILKYYNWDSLDQC